MNWRHYSLLFLLSLAVIILVASFQPASGYMDSDYYFAGGIQLANGHGFTEPFLWNYLDNPSGLPHPSHSYWMPLASLLAAAGAVLFGPSSWSAARVGFVAVAASIPPLTAALAWSFTSRRDLAITSGLLAVFSCFYLPFLPVTDTFGLYMLFGGLFFLVANRQLLTANRQQPISKLKSSIITPILLGLLAGLMHLSRADGLLWLLIAFVAILFQRPSSRSPITFYVSCFALCLAGYLLIMAPWFIRNELTFGSLLAPGGSKMLWLRYYDQIFAYPASQLTFSAWWHSGILAILKARLWALGLNLANVLSVQGEIFLLPLILVGAWHLRKDRRVQLAIFAWGLTLAAMTLAFPFAGSRGGFFHSGAAVQMMCWVLAPIGLERFLEWGGRKRGWVLSQAGPIFRSTLVVLAVLLSATLLYTRLAGGGGGQERRAYIRMDTFLVSKGMLANDIVVVANPPGFYLASGNPAIAVPDGDASTLLAAARRYGVRYLILEDGSVPAGLAPVYENPQGQADWIYLGEVEHARIFQIGQE